MDETVIKKLDDWSKQDLPGPVELYLLLVRLQTEEKPEISLPDALLSQKVISERVVNAIPLLTFDELVLDWSNVERFFQKVTVVINEYSPQAAGPVDIPLKELVRVWYDGRQLPRQPIERDTLTVAIHATMKPFLSKHSDNLLPRIDQGKWRRGYCPICGGRPNFAFLSREQEGARWLLCPRCDAQWLFQRLECPFCGNKEQKKLSYRSDEEGVYRLYLCEECKGYIKCIDMRRAGGDVVLQLEWVATLDLDRQACELGYAAGDLTVARNKR